jgi:hypothetical protein
MGDKATLRLARQELEDLYLGVPDDSVDLTFKDLASSSLPAPATTATAAASADGAGQDDELDNKQQPSLARSSTNIFTYRPLEDHYDAAAAGGGGGGGGALLQLPPSPAAPPTARFPHHHDDDDDYDDQQHHYAAAAAVAGTTTGEGRRSRRSHVADDAAGGRHHRRAAHNSSNYNRPGIPHSNICALCNNYVYLFRHRCLVPAIVCSVYASDRSFDDHRSRIFYTIDQSDR